MYDKVVIYTIYSVQKKWEQQLLQLENTIREDRCGIASYKYIPIYNPSPFANKNL